MIYELLKDRIINGGSGSEAIIESLSISANGVYTASSGVDGYSPITVNVPQKEPNIQNLAISANGTYTAPADIDGYNPITVNVPQKEPNIQNLSITANGTYTAPSGTDGYSPVVVDVQPNLENITITANGTYSHTGKDGYDQVVVNVPQEGLDVSNITITNTLEGLFQNNAWSQLMPYFRNVTLDTISDGTLVLNGGFIDFYSWCDYQDLSHITFKIKTNMYYFNGFSNMFNECNSLKQLPNFDWTLTRSSLVEKAMQFKQAFKNCYILRTIPNTFFSDIPFTNEIQSSSYYLYGSEMFRGCYSLRKVPDLSLFDGLKGPGGSYNNLHQYMFYDCQSLDEIIDLPVLILSNPTGNRFENGFYNCSRIKEMTFKTGTDSAPRTDSGWTSQTIDLSQYVGYALNEYGITGYNSGITADKEVTDDVSYQALKNDPDWWTRNVAYSRYNHDSAVNTINSLPDCSSSGTNTITFLGASGSATDGGAISTLTAEEIAVATAKGWTVTLV